MATEFADFKDDFMNATKQDLVLQQRMLTLLSHLYAVKMENTILVMKLTMLCQDLGVSNEVARKILQWIKEAKQS